MEMFRDLRLEEERAVYSNKYHYSKQTQIWSEFKRIASEDFNYLYKWIARANSKSTSKLYEDKEYYRIRLDKFIKEIEGKKEGDNTIHLYRTIGLRRPEELNKEDMGVCWTWDANRLDSLSNNLLSHVYQKYEVRLHIKASLDNIDWFESFYLFCVYSDYEKELRLIDPSKVKLVGYLFLYDISKTASSIGVVKKWGNSNILYPKYLIERERKFADWMKSAKIDPKSGKVKCYDSISVEPFMVKDGKLRVKFGRVIGDFYCNDISISSFEGFPDRIEGVLTCSNTEITNLKGLPSAVSYYLTDNRKLVSLEGCPETINGNFVIKSNPNLKSLKGGPKEVYGTFDCEECYNLESLEGSPDLVSEDFRCRDCPKLKSMDGVPSLVNGHIYYDQRLDSTGDQQEYDDGKDDLTLDPEEWNF